MQPRGDGAQTRPGQRRWREEHTFQLLQSTALANVGWRAEWSEGKEGHQRSVQISGMGTGGKATSVRKHGRR